MNHILSILLVFVFIKNRINGFPTENVCPSRCTCSNSSIRCRGTTLDSIPQFLLTSVSRIHISDCNFATVNLTRLQNASKLETLTISGCQVESLILGYGVTLSLTHFTLSDNYLSSWEALLTIIHNLPYLQTLDAHYNYLSNDLGGKIDRYLGEKSRISNLDLSENRFYTVPSLPNHVTFLNLSHNMIKDMEDRVPDSVVTLDISHNQLHGSIPKLNGSPSEFILQNLEQLDLSHNKIWTLDFLQNYTFPKLSTVNFSHNPIEYASGITELMKSSKPNNLLFTHTFIRYMDFNWLKNVHNTIDLSQNPQLISLNGTLEDTTIQSINLTGCELSGLPYDFFAEFTNQKLTVDISLNPIICDCQLKWIEKVPGNVRMLGKCQNGAELSLETLTNFSSNLEQMNSTDSCDLGTSAINGTTVRVKYGYPSILNCLQYGSQPMTVAWHRWHLDTPHELLGEWSSNLGWTSINVSESDYEFLPGGVLLTKSTLKANVGRYICTMTNSHGSQLTYFQLRLDYSNWLVWVKLLSVVAGCVFAVVSIIVHSLWSALRACVLWRIRTNEKRSRVRRMIEGMEKYRMKQMEAIHEKYVERMNAVRDNYNQQCEQLRVTYANRVDRFRDYRSQTIDNMRDQYNSQVDRLREYGSRNMERLYDGYQKQMNRVRTFSLQQRLRLMRQYKIKQRYLNKLYDGLNFDEEKGEQRPPSRTLFQETELLNLNSFYPPEEVFILPHIPYAEEDTVSISTYHSLPDMGIQDYDAALTAFGIGHLSPSTSATCTPNKPQTLQTDQVNISITEDSEM